MNESPETHESAYSEAVHFVIFTLQVFAIFEQNELAPWQSATDMALSMSSSL